MSQFKHENIKYEIATPCDQDWDSMSGDDKCRFCSLCEKNVYNLSSMTKDEVSTLIKADQNVCTRVFKRPDGTVLTEDCPVGLKQVSSHIREKKFLTAALCLLAIVYSNLSMAGGRSKLMGKIAILPAIETIEEKEIETVGPEENWDYKNKTEIIEDKEEHVMGFMAPIEAE